MANSLFSDLNQYTPTTKALLENNESIVQSLDNILSTRRYERLFNNDFGLDFEDILFEIIDDATALEVLRIIVERVEKFEPRVVLNLSQTTVEPDPENNKYLVNLFFSVKGQEDLPDQEFQGVVTQAA
jgi:phage baseplate assembly protein W